MYSINIEKINSPRLQSKGFLIFFSSFLLFLKYYKLIQNWYQFFTLLIICSLEFFPHYLTNTPSSREKELDSNYFRAVLSNLGRLQSSIRDHRGGNIKNNQNFNYRLNCNKYNVRIKLY